MNFFNGPLGDHRNYLTHIALPNCFEYLSIQKHPNESGDGLVRAQYEELRRFLNAVESLNNTLEYAYYEFEQTGQCRNFAEFRRAAWGKYPELARLAELANAYKHCVRTERSGKKLGGVPFARDLQKPEVQVVIEISQDKSVKVDAEYKFDGPLPEHFGIFDKALKFWFEYHNSPASVEILDLARG
jgi:hypothetical protein